MQIVVKDEESLLFNDDIERFKKSFFCVMYERKEYIAILYRRLGYISYPLKYICGNYPLDINSRYSMSLGGGIYLNHPHGTHINAAKIGEGLRIRHNVTIGNGNSGRPIIGDNVSIGCGACVLGNIRIGNNVKIGANAVVVKDVPDNVTVVGNPAIIVRQNGMRVNVKL